MGVKAIQLHFNIQEFYLLCISIQNVFSLNYLLLIFKVVSITFSLSFFVYDSVIHYISSSIARSPVTF